jgi:cytochrome c oxidase subunit II
VGRAIFRPAATTERRLARVISVAIGVTAVILFVLLVSSYRTGKAIASLGGEKELEVEVIGHQWWWELRYIDELPSNHLITANELHIPVGRPVRLRLLSRDVIHSFWVPALHGKRDLVPGQEATHVIQADTPGEYVGQCAEFCGLAHARMQLRVVAEEESAFWAWKRAMLQPPPAPTTEETRRGQEVFVRGPCGSCHTIAGTEAAGTVGPDLSHLASQRAIAANTLPNTRGHLAGWLLDPQRLKPGVRMPPNPFTSEDLHALLAYLEKLR